MFGGIGNEGHMKMIKQPEKWIHYSPSPTQIVVYNRDQQEDMHLYSKPKGLWITPEHAENNWSEWCKGADFNCGRLKFIHDIKFNSNANFLRLENKDDIDSFTKEYEFTLADPFPIAGDFEFKGIKWKKVAEKYDGILIPTYIYERRMMAGADWYNPWDCASGCVWNASAIESITVRSTEFSEKEKMDGM